LTKSGAVVVGRHRCRDSCRAEYGSKAISPCFFDIECERIRQHARELGRRHFGCLHPSEIVTLGQPEILAQSVDMVLHLSPFTRVGRQQFEKDEHRQQQQADERNDQRRIRSEHCCQAERTGADDDDKHQRPVIALESHALVMGREC